MEEVEGVKNLENASVQDAKLLLFIRYDYDVITALIKDDMLSDSVNHYNFKWVAISKMVGGPVWKTYAIIYIDI